MSTNFARNVALGMGVVYIGIGLWGFAAAGQGALLGLLAAGSTMAVAHLVVGALAVWASRPEADVRPTLGLVAGLLALLAGLGTLTPAIGLAATGADTIFHAVSALIAAYAAFGTRHEVARA